MSRHITTLKKRKDFLRVQNTTTKVPTKGLVLCMSVPECQSEHPQKELALQVGYTVTKTVGNSVVRNRAKRRLRALVQEVFPSFSHVAADYVLIGRKATLERDYEGLKKDLRYALHTLHKQIAKAA